MERWMTFLNLGKTNSRSHSRHQRPLDEDPFLDGEHLENEEDADPITEQLEMDMDADEEHPNKEEDLKYDEEADRQEAASLRKEKAAKAAAEQEVWAAKKKQMDAELEDLATKYSTEIDSLHEKGQTAAAEAKEAEYEREAARISASLEPEPKPLEPEPKKKSSPPRGQRVAGQKAQTQAQPTAQAKAQAEESPKMSPEQFESLLTDLFSTDHDVDADVEDADPMRSKNQPRLFLRLGDKFDGDLNLASQEMPRWPQDDGDEYNAQETKLIQELGFDKVIPGLDIGAEGLDLLLDDGDEDRKEEERLQEKLGGLPMDDSSKAGLDFSTPWKARATQAELEEAVEKFEALFGLYLNADMTEEAMTHFEYGAFAAHKWGRLEPALTKEWERRILVVDNFNALIAAFLRQNNAFQAASVFKSLAKYCVPDHTTFELMISLYSQRPEPAFSEIDTLLEQMATLGLGPSGPLLDLLSSANYRVKAYDVCIELWEEFSAHSLEPSAASYCFAMTSYCKQGQWEKAIPIFKEARAKGFDFTEKQFPFLFDMNLRLQGSSGGAATQSSWSRASSL